MLFSLYSVGTFESVCLVPLRNLVAEQQTIALAVGLACPRHEVRAPCHQCEHPAPHSKQRQARRALATHFEPNEQGPRCAAAGSGRGRLDSVRTSRCMLLAARTSAARLPRRHACAQSLEPWHSLVKWHVGSLETASFRFRKFTTEPIFKHEGTGSCQFGKKRLLNAKKYTTNGIDYKITKFLKEQ